jgi:hypothetical protein
MSVEIAFRNKNFAQSRGYVIDFLTAQRAGQALEMGRIIVSASFHRLKLNQLEAILMLLAEAA